MYLSRKIEHYFHLTIKMELFDYDQDGAIRLNITLILRSRWSDLIKMEL